MNQVMTIEVADFVEAVDAELADLPADVRAELLEDLPAHLADVLAEGGTPTGELGEPAAYAAELRMAAGHPPTPSGRSGRVEVFAKLWAVDVRIGSAIGYPRLTELFRALQPAWWVLRGYLVVQLVTGVQSREGGDALTPQVRGSVVLGAVAVLAACALSVWLGRRPATPGRRAVSAIAVAAALWGAALTAQSVFTSASADVAGSPTYYGELGDTSNITNIYPYGPDGKVLKNVRLVDQDGNPITIDSQCDVEDIGGPQVFPVVCKDGGGSFDPQSPLEPLPSIAPSTSAAASTVPPAATPAVPTPTPTPTPSPTPSR